MREEQTQRKSQLEKKDDKVESGMIRSKAA